ncbi:hypothetical protein NIT7645_00868 [Phaeobacter italicus]|nr:hypothetical protein NIT7645_00868 [Phaeobacter italicus]SFG06852.1 hypothetical protein SAMN04488019_101203 [Phaeobacter italicus]
MRIRNWKLAGGQSCFVFTSHQLIRRAATTLVSRIKTLCNLRDEGQLSLVRVKVG